MQVLDYGYYNLDCMEGMRHFPDKYFDLAIVDPPYGINVTTGGRLRKYNTKTGTSWDSKPPSEDYFKELFRVSKHCVIWGAITSTYHPRNAS